MRVCTALHGHTPAARARPPELALKTREATLTLRRGETQLVMGYEHRRQLGSQGMWCNLLAHAPCRATQGQRSLMAAGDQPPRAAQVPHVVPGRPRGWPPERLESARQCCAALLIVYRPHPRLSPTGHACCRCSCRQCLALRVRCAAAREASVAAPRSPPLCDPRACHSWAAGTAAPWRLRTLDSWTRPCDHPMQYWSCIIVMHSLAQALRISSAAYERCSHAVAMCGPMRMLERSLTDDLPLTDWPSAAQPAACTSH